MDKNEGTAAEFAKLLAVVAELRTQCPWDRDQKLGDTPRHLIEEAYEVADAVARGEASEIADELGDLIAQCMFVATILGENSELDMAAVLDNWDRIKQQERETKKSGKPSAMSIGNTRRALPSLMRAEKLGAKAR